MIFGIGLGVAVMVVASQWVSFARMQHCRSTAMVIADVLPGRNESMAFGEEGLLKAIRELARQEADRNRAATIIALREERNESSLRDLERIIYVVESTSESCESAFCVLSSHRTDWNSQATVVVDMADGTVSVQADGQGSEDSGALDGYVVTWRGDVLRIPSFSSTRTLARFFCQGSFFTSD